jgi:hypothetical protein
MNDRSKMALMTYEASVVCFYRFIESSKQTQQLCVGEAFLPAPVLLF